MNDSPKNPIVLRPNGVQTPANNADINQIIDGVNNLLNLANGVVNLVKAEQEAKLEIAKIDREMEKMSYELEIQQKDREYNLEQIKMLHDKMQELIMTATQLSLRPNVSDTELQLIQMFMSLANNCLNTIANLS